MKEERVFVEGLRGVAWIGGGYLSAGFGVGLVVASSVRVGFQWAVVRLPREM